MHSLKEPALQQNVTGSHPTCMLRKISGLIILPQQPHGLRELAESEPGALILEYQITSRGSKQLLQPRCKLRCGSTAAWKVLCARVQQGASHLRFCLFATRLLKSIALRFQLTFLCACVRQAGSCLKRERREVYEEQKERASSSSRID